MNENCNNGQCYSGPRVVVGKIDDLESKSLELIMTRNTCASQLMRMLPKVSEGEYTEKDISAYVQGVVEAMSDARYLEADWWRETMISRNLTGEVYIDFITKELWKKG